jgi:hypothetical protein
MDMTTIVTEVGYVDSEEDGGRDDLVDAERWDCRM